MEAIQGDLLRLKLQEDKNQYRTLQEICGASQDGSYSDPIQFMYTNSTNMISIGSLSNITQGQSVNIQFNLENSLIHMDRCFIVGELTLDQAIMHTYLDLIRPIQFSYGSQSIPFTNGQFLVKQKLMRMSHKKLRKYSKMIGLQTDAFSKSTDDDETTLYSGWDAFFRTQAKWMKTDNGKIKFALPLHLVFPNLQHDQKTLWCGMGQTLQLQAQLNQQSDCLIAIGDNPSYRLDNCGLLYAYSKLPQTVCDNILKSRVMIPKIRHIWFGTAVATSGTTINCQYNISKKERLRFAYFSFTSVRASINVDCAATGTENMVTQRNGGFNRYHYPLIGGVALPLQQLQIDLNGRVFTVQNSALQILHLVDDSDKYKLQVHPAEHPYSQVYCIDLQRFAGEDAYGSSSSESGVMRMSITLQTGQKTIYGQGANWSVDAAANGVASIVEYQFHSFVEAFQQIHIESGVYI